MENRTNTMLTAVGPALKADCQDDCGIITLRSDDPDLYVKIQCGLVKRKAVYVRQIGKDDTLYHWSREDLEKICSSERGTTVQGMLRHNT